MATPEKCIELETAMADNSNQRLALEEGWKAMKAEHDRVLELDRLSFKLGIKTQEEHDRIVALLTG